MRKLMWFSLGFGAACALGLWQLSVAWLIPVAAVCLVFCLLSAKLRLRPVAALLLGCSVGLIWYFAFQQLYLIPAKDMDGETIDTTITATDYSFDTDYGVAVDGEFQLDGRTWKLRLYTDAVSEIRPGDTIKGSVKLRYTAPGGMRDPTFHAGDGILFLGYQRGHPEITSAPEPSGHWAARLRHGISHRLNDIFPEDTSAFVRALLLGDGSDLDYATDTALKVSGIRHIIAVSGLHVAMLYSILRAITLNRRYLTALIGLPVLFLFAAVAGFTPSVSRACIMIGIIMVARVANKDYDSATALSFAALVMLLRNPLVISSISFQMSFACVAGILLFFERIAAWLKAKFNAPEGKSLKACLYRWLITSVSMSLSAIVLTTPMSAFYFGTVSLVGVLTNLLTLWAVSFAFYGVVLACIVSLFWLKAAAAVAWIASWAVRYVVLATKILAKFPLAAVYTQSICIVLWLMFAYILLLIFLVSEKRSPRILFCCAVLGLCAALLFSWTEHTFSDVHFTALDVGQGQSLILHSEGKTYLIDCGGSNDEIAANTAAETLLSRGITRLDGIILTHGDRDHAGGLTYLLTRIDTSCIFLPATTEASQIAALDEITDAKIIPVSVDLMLSLNSANIRIFGPLFAHSSNENSLCVLFERENCAILVTGDRSAVGEEVLLSENLPQVDLLIAGHHGSKYSTSDLLLFAVKPDTVFISVGHNAYGHPAREVLDRLAAYGCTVYRTDISGNLVFRR